jgi:hypothetical protein
MRMATVNRLVCDIDRREEDVFTVVIDINGRSGVVDMCGRCRSSVPMDEAFARIRPETRKRKQEFVKIELPPQP